MSATRCPCDLDLLNWLRLGGQRSRVILHFGTGEHHAVGRAARAVGGHAVLGVTASAEEFAIFRYLVRRDPEVARWYQVFLTDIYTLPESLVPPLDVLRLFHLCEFTPDVEADADRSLLTRLSRRVRPGGNVIFYAGSDGFARAQPLIAEAVTGGRLVDRSVHDSLHVYRVPL